MSPKKTSDHASSSNGRKGLDVLPDLEDLGKVLKTCNPGQERKPEQRKAPDGQDCQTCDRRNTCETVVQASSELMEQGSSKGRENTQHTKEMINPTRSLMEQRSKGEKEVSKQGPKMAILLTAENADQGVSANLKAPGKTPTLSIAEGQLNDPDVELGN